MFNLLNVLTDKDNELIEKYIEKYGLGPVESHKYIGNKEYLSLWAKNKPRLYHLLGGNLIYKMDYEAIKSEDEVKSDLIAFLKVEDKFFANFYYELNKIKDDRDKKGYDEELMDALSDLKSIASYNTIINNKLPYSIKYKEEDKKTLQFQRGEKPIRAIKKAIDYFEELHCLKNEYERVRIAHSMVLNDNKVRGKLCLSIHPLDFMTMSDNNNDWSSCMSWKKEGCYRVGTVEMMNSNNVICAYLESASDWTFDTKNNFSWNNKKWRSLFYVTNDIIMSGKSYPTANKQMTLFTLEIIKDLCKINLNREFEYGPELYKDMTHIHSMYRFDKNREWLQTGDTKKQNILFDTKGMYNDMFNDGNTDFYCYRNKIRKMKIISVSGKSKCLCCSNEVISESDYLDCDDGYNERFSNTNALICEKCQENFSECFECGDRNGVIYEVNGRNYCLGCVNENLRLCPDCGKVFYPYDYRLADKQSVYVKKTDKPLSEYFMQDVSAYSNEKCERIYMCSNCLEKRNIVKIKLTVDENRHFYSWDSTEKSYKFIDEKWDREKINKYLPHNFKRYSIE